jgi:hypothetical protein
MGQRRITLELTEYQARVIRWALDRALTVSPAAMRHRMLWQKLNEAYAIVAEATEGLEPIQTHKQKTPPIPRKVRSTPAYAFTGIYGTRSSSLRSGHR